MQTPLTLKVSGTTSCLVIVCISLFTGLIKRPNLECISDRLTGVTGWVIVNWLTVGEAVGSEQETDTLVAESMVGLVTRLESWETY